MAENEVKENPGVEEFETSADKSEGARKITLTYNFGKDLDEAVQLHGAEVVYGMFVKSLKIAIQANVRRMMAATKEDGTLEYTDEAIKNWVENEYKPGVRTARVPAEQKLEKMVASLLKLSPEKRAEILAKLTA